jgi:hypothetical protein
MAAGRALSLLLAGLVLVGGICPAVYGALQPHRHLFLGGPPPADWQNHAHPNPLYRLLGPPAGAAVSDARDEVPRPGATAGLDEGRVVSLYAGDLDVLSLFLDAVVLVPAMPALEPPGPTMGVEISPSPVAHQVSDEPAVPPPRPR